MLLAPFGVEFVRDHSRRLWLRMVESEETKRRIEDEESKRSGRKRMIESEEMNAESKSKNRERMSETE